MSEALKFIQLPANKVEETLKNKSLTKNLQTIADLAKTCGENGAEVSSKLKGNFLYSLGTRLKPQWEAHLPLIVKHICNDGIRNDAQFNAAIDYLMKSAVTGVDETKFVEASGAGIVVSQEEIEDGVQSLVRRYADELKAQRYSFNVGRLLGELRQTLRWADGAKVKQELDMQIFELLGPKTQEELAPQPKKKAPAAESSDKKAKTAPAAGKAPAPKAKAAAAKTEADNESADSIEELLRTRTHFHKVGENFQTDGYVVTPKTMELLKKHVAAVGGKVHTRFPPEPNGILHIGHAKAININFGYAKAHGGNCYLRFDDTNPEKEEEKFFRGIQDIVEWLGYKPYKITHSSDYFDQLYEWAEVLIQKDMAYVCHQKVEEMRGFDVVESPYRNRPKEESLKLFRAMKKGFFDEGEATLRLKTILEEGKVDPVAYRIKFVPHHRTGNKWCIYPTYDYTHCLCDSIENITHSLCTKEFQSRRSSYYWLCNSLEIYCPVQWEYARLNVSYTVVSKRKILKLIENRVVNDWDDPRLFTLTALRRRGIPAEAVNKFVAKLGLTVAQTCVDPSMLDSVVRDHLNVAAPRTMAVLEPLKLTIENFDEFSDLKSVEVPDFPADEGTQEGSGKKHIVTFDRTVYIEQDDYREEGEKGFRRLTKSQSVGLKYVGLVLNIVGEDPVEGLVVRAARLDASNKPKAFVHWICKPKVVEVRLYEKLFRHANPEDKAVVPDGFLSDLNPNTLRIIPNALCDSYVTAKGPSNYQFERVGFFALDPDTTAEKLVFNRTVSLREDSGKN